MMKYITKVDSYHVIALNGTNVKVKELSSYFTYEHIDINKNDIGMISCNQYKHLAEIVVSTEMVKLILEQGT